MGIEILIEHIEWSAENAKYYGYLIVFILMFLESSVVPLPSEIIMIPAGFMAARCEFTVGSPWIDLVLVTMVGTFGALAAAHFNYYLAKYFGRYFLYKYGKYFLMKPKLLKKAEKEFSKYGDFATFICRLIPTARQLISIPAGLSEMPILKFSILTFSGSFIWTAILTGTGFYFGMIWSNMTYRKLIKKSGKAISSQMYWFVFLAILLLLVYILIKKAKNKKC